MPLSSRENKSDVARSFLLSRFGNAPSHLFALIWRKQGKVSRWLPVGRLSELDLSKLCEPSAGDVYVGVALSPEDFGDDKRCAAEAAAGIPGLWLDIDIQSGAHKADNLPPTIGDARELAYSLGAPPTEIIHSGFGLHAYWLFREPWVFVGDAERAQAADLSERFQAAFRRNAQALGWRIDSTHDLARILRLPGTWNCKGESPVLACVLHSGGPRYDRQDLAALVEEHDDTHKSNGTVPHHTTNGCTVADRARRYVARMPGAVSGQGGHVATFAVAQVLVRGFDLDESEAWPILSDYNRRCEPEWSDKELRHKLDSAASKSKLPRGYLLVKDGDGTSRVRAPRQEQRQDSPPEPFAVGSLTLKPERVRRTNSGKLVVTLDVCRGLDLLHAPQLTSTASCRKELARTLADLAGDGTTREQIERELIRLLAHCEKTEREAPPAARPTGPTVAQVVADVVPAALLCVYRTDKGLWSEARGGEVTRGEFIGGLSSRLMERAAEATDAPKDEDGRVQRLSLIKLVESELKVLWGDLCATLPTAAGADLGKNTEAGRRFRAALVKLWTALVTFEKTTHESGDMAARASLISRVRTAWAPLERDHDPILFRRPGWRNVQPAVDAWWRPHLDKGELRIILAMRWTLAEQMRVSLPGVTDEGSLTALGERFGVLDPKPPVPRMLSKGKARLVVLSADLTDELMGEPMNEEFNSPVDAG